MAKHYNFIYEELVRYDGDMVGRIAYSIYKREKIAFIEQYKKANGGKGNFGVSRRRNDRGRRGRARVAKVG